MCSLHGKTLGNATRSAAARASSSTIVIMRHVSTIDRCVPKHLDVVNARVVSMAVVVQNFEQQRVRERGRAAVGLLAHKDLREGMRLKKGGKMRLYGRGRGREGPPGETTRDRHQRNASKCVT